ncbi:hypothetical protein KXD96_11780 [Mycobacterium sp. SMC-2]|uniref:hypothetical protein n=1 Tax=Mycobacterium sp. SMC-2 TaxID=2857058 RepID=UPI0021B46CCF|nr:hypothetical protein [Mycobacterium sp. SMC-2]UXA08682.1 hypothetical protein KXD96_11780 [Mycobacterium sp. SMC-2]
MNGTTADLWRASGGRDRHGDPQGGYTFLGTIANVLVGSISSQRYSGNEARQESADGGGSVGFERNGKLTTGEPAPVVKFGDRLVIGGSQPYEVTSDANWGTPHSMTGWQPPRYYVDVRYRR